MGYLTRHIITIVPQTKATPENYLKIRAAIAKALQDNIYESLSIYGNRMDDFVFNYGFGSKWYHNDYAQEVSKTVPDLTIRFRCIGESRTPDALRDETFKDGGLIERKELDADEFSNSYGRQGRYT